MATDPTNGPVDQSTTATDLPWWSTFPFNLGTGAVDGITGGLPSSTLANDPWWSTFPFNLGTGAVDGVTGGLFSATLAATDVNQKIKDATLGNLQHIEFDMLFGAMLFIGLLGLILPAEGINIQSVAKAGELFGA